MKKINGLLNNSLKNKELSYVVGGKNGYIWKATNGHSDEQLHTYDVSDSGVVSNHRTDGGVYDCSNGSGSSDVSRREDAR